MIGVANDEPHSLRSRCTFGELNISMSMVLQIVPLEGHIVGLCHVPSPFKVNIATTLSLRRVLLEMQTLVAADYNRVNKLTADGLLYAAKPSVALATLAAAIYDVNLTELEARVSVIQVGPIEQDGGPLGVAVASAADNFIKAFLDTPHFQNILPNALDTKVFPLLRSTFNSRVASFLMQTSPGAMPDGGAMKPHPTKGIESAHIAVLAVLVAFLFIPVSLFIYSLVSCLTQRKSINHLNYSRGPVASISTKKSLSAVCSPTVQYALPTMFVANMAIGLWSILVPVCDVRIKVVGGLVDPLKPIANDSLLVYSFFQMLHDFWQSGAQVTACLLLMGSLVLPQVCGWLSLVAFGAPTSPELRGAWCRIHIIVIRFLFVSHCFICLVVCTLRSQLAFPWSTVNIVAEPIDGLVSGAVGTFIAFVNAGLLLYLHESSLANANARSVCGRPNLAELTPIVPSTQISRKLSVVGTVGAIITCVCVYGAFTNKLLTFTISGLAGTIESSRFSTMSNIKDVWLVSLPSNLYSSTDEHAIALVIGCLFFLLAVGAPVTCCIAWLAQWLSALVTGSKPSASNSRVLRLIAAASPYLYGWCATDVFWSAAAAACFEMDLGVQFIVMRNAGPLCSQVQDHLGLPCVHVDGTLLTGAWWLLAFVGVSWAMFGVTSVAFKLDEASSNSETRSCQIAPGALF